MSWGFEKRPGVYFRTQNVTLIGRAISTNIVAMPVQADWGPINTPTEFNYESEIDIVYGSAGTTQQIKLALREGAIVLATRIGDAAGVKGTLVGLHDTTGSPIDVVTLLAKYVGTRDIRVSIQDSLTDTTKRELLIYDITTLKEVITFTKGTGGVGEPAALVAAVNATSEWITATKLADGNKLMAIITGSPFVSGANPAVTNTEYTAGFTAMDSMQMDLVCVDTDTTTVHALLEAFVESQYAAGIPCIAVVGEPTTVAIATRLADSAAFNNKQVVYIGNGVIDSALIEYEGYKAAAILAGVIAAMDPKISATHYIMTNYSTIKGSLSNSYINQAIDNGMVVFSQSSTGAVQIEYDITTLVSPGTDEDDGWKSIRRVRERFELIKRCKSVTDPLLGVVNNDSSGRASLIMLCNGEVKKMKDEGKLTSGTVTVDPLYDSAGDYSYFLLTVDDNDSIKKAYMTFQFRYAPAS